MTELNTPQSAGKPTSTSPACCDSVLLDTCCEAQSKPVCCGPQASPQRAPAKCGCRQSGG